MSHNPYAPPVADLGLEVSGRALAGRGDFDIGQCVSEAWAHTWSNVGVWLVGGIVFFLATALATLTGIGLLLAVPVLFWGFTYFTLRLHDGGAEVGDLFAGFSRYGKALGTMLALFIAIMLISLLGQSVELLGAALDNPWVRAVGALVNLGFTFLVTPRLNFSYMLAVDRDLPALEALRRSWEDTSPVKWKIVALLLLTMVFMIIGFLALVVGAIPAAVFATLCWVSAYRQMYGGPAGA